MKKQYGHRLFTLGELVRHISKDDRPMKIVRFGPKYIQVQTPVGNLMWLQPDSLMGGMFSPLKAKNTTKGDKT